jgi:hypothetical protein
MVLVLLGSALLAFDGEKTELKNINTVTEEDRFTPCLHD